MKKVLTELVKKLVDFSTPIPVSMTDKVPQTSRFLDALGKNYEHEHQMVANAISFGSYRKDGE